MGEFTDVKKKICPAGSVFFFKNKNDYPSR